MPTDTDRRGSSQVPSPLLDRLTDINLDDLFEAAGWTRLRNTPLERLLRPTARRFACLAHEFDAQVGERGLAHGGAWMMSRMTAGWTVSGVEHVPSSGPVVVLANHPGMTDTVALLASLEARPDLRVIALDRPFLRSLPNVARRLILLPGGGDGRMGVLRAGVRHLETGGALLTFPAGEIEPDPATFGRLRAIDSVRGWSDSFVLFARRVPRTRFVPAIVGDVVSPDAQRHVLARLRRTEHDRQRLAAALQVALPRFRRRIARVAFGPARQAGAEGPDRLRSAIVEQVIRLIEATAGDERRHVRGDRAECAQCAERADCADCARDRRSAGAGRSRGNA